MNKSNRISRKAKHSVKAEVDRRGTLSSGDEEGGSRGGNSGRTPYPHVSFTEIHKGNERLFFIKNEMESEESLSVDPQDYHLEIDNFSIIDVQDTSRRQDAITRKASRASKICIPSSSAGHLSGEQLTLLQVLDNGQCLLETTTEQITFHSAEDDNALSQTFVPEHEQLQPLDRRKTTQLRNENEQRTRQISGDTQARLKKVCQWSKRKVKHFLQCVQNHEQKFRKRNKKDFLIWNEIAKDMFALGHRDCNKDECFKKWSNLYRTWKIVSSRPKEGRRRWQIFDQITNIVKFMSQRGSDKSLKKSVEAKHSLKDLMKQMLEQNLKHKEAIRKKLDNFNARVSRLDEERDELIDEIGKILQKA